MENKLKKLFDYQRFEKNADLEKLISETEGRCSRELSEEEASLVSAAGDPAMNAGAFHGNEAPTDGGGIYKP